MMIAWWIILGLLLLPASVWAQGGGCQPAATVRFAAPTGLASNNGLTQATPFRIQDFWAVAAPGWTLCLMDGTYTGAAQMVSPPTGLNGTTGNPITIRAINDGAVLIDAGPTDERWPLNLNGQDWYVIEGINFARGDACTLCLYGGANNNILRRVIAFDAPAVPSTNCCTSLALIWDSSNNLFEDVAIFGLASQTMLEFGNNAFNTFRRLWVRNEGYRDGSTGMTGFEYGYGDNPVSHVLVENSIFIWDTRRGLPGYPGGALLGKRNNQYTDHSSPPERFLGTLMYNLNTGSHPDTPNGFLVHREGDALFQDMFMDMGGNNSLPTNMDSSTQPNATINRMTIRHGSQSPSFGSAWSITGLLTGTTLSGMNLFASANPPTNAALCYRYLNGSLTQTPLWPWPMDARIKAAIAAFGSNALAGSAGTAPQTHVANTVTSEVIARYGAIPTACYGPGEPPPPIDPPGPFPTTAQLDNFNRPDGPLGGNWTTTLGSGLVISSAAAQAPDATTFHASMWAPLSFNPDQEWRADIVAPPSEASGAWMVGSWRGNTTTGTWYSLALARVAGSNNDTLVFYHVPSSTQPCPPVALGFDAAAGDAFGARSTGTTHEFWYKRGAANWERVGTCSDSTIQTGGRIGLGTGGAGTFDNFGGGTVGSDPAGTNPPNQIQHPAVTQIVPITEIKKTVTIP